MKPSYSPLFIITVLISYSQFFGQQPVSPLWESFYAYNAAKEKSTFGMEWIQLGPVVNSARVEAVQLDPSRPGTMYAAFGSGNLWKTTDHGISWKAIFENQAAQGIGDIALAPSNTDIIYLGTGESLKKARNFTMPGVGVFRSDDAGDSWRHLGLDDAWHIGEIAVHPQNPEIVFVAVLGHFWSTNQNRGLYRTIDGGKTWDHVLYIDEKTGANDVVIAPSDPNIVYVSMWENNPGVNGINSSVYKSIDGGKHFEKAAQGLPQTEGTGRIGLAVSHQNAQKVYALIDNRDKLESGVSEVYRSENGGETWKRSHEKDLQFSSVIGWYFMDIYVNPQDDEEIFALGVRLAHSTNGGESFKFLGGTVRHVNKSIADHLHLDHCELWINPQNPDHLALGNDGGFYLSYDKGKSWMHFNNIPAGEFYDISLDHEDPYHIYGGTQDDATVFGPAREWNSEFEDPWKYLWIDAWSGGDGCMTHIDPSDKNTIYFSLQNGAVRRKNMLTGESVSIRPEVPKRLLNKVAYNFITPYFLSPHNPQTLYQAGNFVFKSTDRGDDWKMISQDLSESQYVEKRSLAAGAMAESPLQAGLLFVGMDKGAFWVSDDDGKHWEERSEGLPNNYIRSIVPSAYSTSRVYASLTGINYDDLGAYVYASEDLGQTWTSIRSNLPDQPINVVLEDPFFEDVLYVGTLRGVFISLDRGQHWELLGKGIPSVAIADLEIHKGSKELIAATHGRGIYKVGLSPLYHMFKGELSQKKAHLLPIPTATRPLFNDTHKDPNYATISKVPISFFLPISQEISLVLVDRRNRVVWQKDIQGREGLNEFRWDLITQKRQSDSPYFVHYDTFLDAGKYTMILKIGDKELGQAFTVKEYSLAQDPVHN